MVRLLLFFFFKLAAAYLCFNSSMVRLLLKISRSGEIQFNVSIPQWYDYYFTNHFAIIPSALVSIPQWYDYYLLNNNNIPILNGVSIPQWYDYYFCLNYLQPFAISFNSSMVRLLLHVPIAAILFCIGFNSSMVRLLLACLMGWRTFVHGFNSSMVRLLPNKPPK